VSKSVAIVGGGLAGIAAAIRLCEADGNVTLIETRKKLGGRATSFIDPRTGERLDNCQHVLMGCCTNLIDLYDRLGVLDLIEWHRTLYWTAPGRNGEYDMMQAGLLPAPMHFTRSFQKMRIFSREDKRAIARAMWRLIRMGQGGRHEWRNRTFAEFLRETKQTPNAMEGFWNTVIVSACNLPIDRVGAEPAMQVFQEGFLANKWSYTMGLASVPLLELYDPAVEFIASRGGRILLGASARSIGFDGRRVTGVVTGDEVIETGSVISAVPFDRLDKLISPSMREVDARLQKLHEINVSPILGVHLRFDQMVMDLPHLVLANSAVSLSRDAPAERSFTAQWLFNKGVDEDGRQHIHAVVSAADELMPLKEEEIVERIVADIHRALPKSTGLQPSSARSVKEKRATFAALPGVDDVRPTAAPGTVGLKGGGIMNLYLAGDWCDTGWPATMEGAVRSGYAAAGAILGEKLVVEDVPPGLFAAVLGLRQR
jgi:hydroxysqualene dehydroxylase